MRTAPEGHDPGPNLTAPLLAGVWLTSAPVQIPIEDLLLAMVRPNQPHPLLQRSVIEDLHYAIKRTEVVLAYLSLQEVGLDAEGEIPLVVVSPKGAGNTWREALLLPGGDCPIGIVVNTRDRGRLVLVHEVFSSFSELQKDLVRRSAGLAARGWRHEQVVEALSGGPGGIQGYADLVADARRQVQSLDPSVLFSPDYEIRVQLGSLAQTTRNLLLEGLRGEDVFILPATLFEGKANYGDIEFVIYLDFFVRHGLRTRIIGTVRQHDTLARLLALVLFGLFDPGAAEQPSFERLAADFGVPDRDTYEFLRVAYETYGVRRGSDPAGPILGVEGYVDFIPLDGEETLIPISRQAPGGGLTLVGNVWVRSRGADGFDVRIEQADGRSSARRMEMCPPRRRDVTVPEALCRPIRFATDRPRFGVTVLGTSHGFDPIGDLTSFVIWINGCGILVDPSPEALAYLEQIGVAPVDVPYVFLTHIHADHDSGLLEKVLSGSRTTLIASDVVFRGFLEKVRLVTGHDFAREGLVNHVAANPGAAIPIEVGGETAVLETRWNLHPIPTNGFKIHFAGRSFGYAGDTQYDPALIHGLRDRGKLTPAQQADLLWFFWTPEGTPTVDLLYHEAGGPPIHTPLDRLQALPEAVKARTFLVHVADKDVPAGSVPGKPPQFTTHVLLPPTEPSQHHILLETMRLVSYLYDIPSDTLEELLRGATLRDYATDEIIIRKGPVPQHEPLHFYVLADGEVAIKDGRRLITKLGKGTTYGEWGISHQRGLRVADVMAARPCRCIQFGEAHYWWLVEKHPVIQDRIAKIRSLLPRIEIAQARMRLKAAADPLMRRSLIEEMTPGQLAGFAIFSEVRTFQRGQTVVVEGAEADGFYILLSGHLTVHARGLTVGELGEGDVFGEIGVLEGRTRQATVSVASADAEVLFMSTHNFQRLLEAMPVFSWEVREIAAHRRELSRQAAHASSSPPPWRREFTP